jgi:hypothetical protein
MSCNLTIVWKASLTRAPPPICTFAPGSQTALIWRAAGRCERNNSYIMSFFPQQQDSPQSPPKPASSAQNQAAAFICCSKVLYLCVDSMLLSTVIFLPIEKNIFINRLLWPAVLQTFPTAVRRYADK